VSRASALGVIVRGEHVALLSVAGAIVAVAGAWIMRRAQSLPERPVATAIADEEGTGLAIPDEEAA
jgi:hypothetical protein